MKQGNKSLSENFDETKLVRGYFKAPDCIFQLPLSPFAKLIFLYLCRRADRDGFSFPSLDRIAKDCFIKSRTTVANYLRELIRAGFVFKGKSNGHNTYRISKNVLSIIRTCSFGEHPTPDEDDQRVHQMDNPCSLNGHTPVHDVDTKEYTEKENPFKEPTKGKEDINFSSIREKEDCFTYQPKGKPFSQDYPPAEESPIRESKDKAYPSHNRNHLDSSKWPEWSPENRKLIREKIEEINNRLPDNSPGSPQELKGFFDSIRQEKDKLSISISTDQKNRADHDLEEMRKKNLGRLNGRAVNCEIDTGAQG